MYLFFKNFKKYKLNRGMSYVELIVVLSIFSIMSTLVIFSYDEFQARVDMKNLANDVALKIIQAQKDATFGKLPTPAQQLQIPFPGVSSWKPSYGVDFNLSNNQSFIYFVDLNSNKIYEGTDCTGECVEKINITKGNSISLLEVVYQDLTRQSVNDIILSFTRPSSTAVFSSSSPLNPNISYIQITIISPKSTQSNIKLYSSGRVQIN